MGLFDRWRDLRMPVKIGIILGILAVIAAAVIAYMMYRNDYSAKMMRLVRVEGTVTLEDELGSTKTIVDNMRFSSGQALNTGAASLASISLDDSKLVTMEENSRVCFAKNRNSMELKLTSGGLFFEVDKPLQANETLDIRTSTMVVGIRGTSGYVFVDEDGNDCMIVTSGHVHVIGINPATYEQKEIDVSAGQKVTTYLYNDRNQDTVDFALEDCKEEDLPRFTIDQLVNNADLLAKVCEETGWDADVLLGIANGSITVPADPTEEAAETTAAPTTAAPTTVAPITPTATATVVPTEIPTTAPATETAKPTAKPTKKPTAKPTKKPTAKPTKKPAKPTADPTSNPSRPTVEPDPTTDPSSIHYDPVAPDNG